MDLISLDALVIRLGIALGVGFLVGLERERQKHPIAGVRTFALVSLLGGVTCLLSLEFGGWILAAGFFALAAMVILGNVGKYGEGRYDPGITTEVALLLTFALGAFLIVGSPAIGVALGGTLAVLLHAKASLHRVVDRLGDPDVTAIMRFSLVALVILPVLPDEAFGPFGVLNPRQIWLVVVLIVGIGLGGYLAYKFLGGRMGTAVAGVLGGIISSTATTVSYARQSREDGDAAELAAVVVLISSAVVFVRLLVEISVVAPSSLRVAAPPLLVWFFAFVVLSVTAWSRGRSESISVPEPENPTEFRYALAFGALYAVILMALAVARESVGTAGLYGIAAVSGLANLDAITLSTASLARAGTVTSDSLWRAVTVAALSNLGFKFALAGVLGPPRLVRHLAPYFLAGAGVGAILLAFWP